MTWPLPNHFEALALLTLVSNADEYVLTCCYVAAFEVDDAIAMEKRLQYFGIEYTRVTVPDTEATQLFFYDLHGYVAIATSAVAETQGCSRLQPVCHAGMELK